MISLIFPLIFLQLPNPGIELLRPLLFVGHAFAATSMQSGLRLAGTVEFAGLKAPPNYARARALAEQPLCSPD